MARKMERCEQCGAILVRGRHGLCAACAQTKRRSGPRHKAIRSMAVVAALLGVVFLAMGTASVLLYQRYNPEQFAAALTAALEQADTQALAQLVTGEDVAVSQEGLLALCRAFADEQARTALADQVLTQAVSPQAAGTYPALSVAEKPVFLGYSTYRLQVHSARLLLTAPAQNLLLTLGDTLPTGESTAEGVLYQYLFPGSYLCTVTGTSITGQTVTGEPTQVDLFSYDPPTAFDGALPLATVTVAGCVSDEAEISVDGVLVPQRPQDGVVTLPQVAVGSTISLRYTAPHGAVTTASVVFADASATSLAFENSVAEGGIPAQEDVNTLLRAYYAAYLDAVNNQDIARAATCTDAWREQLAAALADEELQAAVFTFTDAVCEPASLAACTVGELPGFVCNATVTYEQTDRSTHQESTVSLPLSVEFVFENGAWAVSQVAVCSAEDYANNIVSAFS